MAYKENVKMPNIVMDLNNTERDARFIKLEKQIKEFKNTMENYMQQTNVNFTKLCEGFETIKRQNDAMPARIERIISTIHSETVKIGTTTVQILNKLNEFDTANADDADDSATAEALEADDADADSNVDDAGDEADDMSSENILEAADDEIPAEWVD